MSARGISSPFAAAIASPSVQLFDLVELGFDGATQYLCQLDFAVPYGGNTYTNQLGLVQIEDVSETAQSYEGLRVTISGVSQTNLALILANKVRGRVARLRTVALVSGTLVVDDRAWVGYMDTPLYTLEGGQATIQIACENRFSSWNRAQPIYFTNAWQQVRFPGDKGLEFVEDMANRRITFPSAEWFKL